MRNDEDRGLEGGGYGGAQGAGGAGRDDSGAGELQGGSSGRGWGRADATEGIGARGAANEDEDEARRRLAEPPQVVDEDGREATIEDPGRSPDRGELGRTEES